MSANVGLERMLFAIAHESCANLTTTSRMPMTAVLSLVPVSSNPALVFVGMPESGSATDESLVYFNFAIRPTEFQERAILHCKTDAMEHEPSRLLSDTECASNLVRANAVLAIRNHPNSDEPLVERERRILEDSPDLARELFASVLPFAFPHPASGNESNIIAATCGALNTVRPAARHDEVEAVVRVREMLDGLLESLWFGAPHCQKYARNALLSQVYYSGTNHAHDKTLSHSARYVPARIPDFATLSRLSLSA